MQPLRIRPARADEADDLTALCVQSKAYWGYDANFMRLSAVALAVTPSMIDEGCVLVAEDLHSRLVGVAAVARVSEDGKFDLARLFVLPSAFGIGIGRALFEAAVALAARQGGASLLILSDPFAEAFYERLGAVKIGDAPSDAIPGRRLPLLEYAIPNRRI
ncbi:MAG TPA: GNAT family N-acetyltransferase [Alphaproteobacteria bacterium]|nr:GNAT family N-acetyltransferase [Alphaproteobacteria bacterium]